jgi:hypothetical protein
MEFNITIQDPFPLLRMAPDEFGAAGYKHWNTYGVKRQSSLSLQ